MKSKLFYLVLQIIIAATLLAGILLVFASFQSFETLASLLDKLASDGKLDSFTVSLYQTLKAPLALIGTGLILLAGWILLGWNRTKWWIETIPTQTRHFFHMLRQDVMSFLVDAREAFNGLGRAGIVILVGSMLVGLLVRLGNLDLPFSHDEAYTYNAFASRSVWHIISDYHLPNNHVLLSLLIHITTGLLGNHIWVIRLPTILAGVLLVPATFWFAKRFYSRETALSSATLVAVFPVLVKYSIYARGYILISLITLLLFALGDYGRVKQNRFAWMLVVILSALGLFTIPVMLFPFGALYIWLLASWAIGDTRFDERRSSFLKYWLVSGFSAAILTILLYLPIMVNSYDRFFGNGFIAPVEWSIFPETIWVRLRNTWFEWTESLPLWLVGLGVLGILFSLFLHKKIAKPKFPLQFAFLIWITVMLVARRPDMLPRFWLFLAVPVLMWAVAGIVEPLKLLDIRVAKKWSLAQALVGLSFAFVVLFALTVLPSIPSKWSSTDGMANVTLYLKNTIQQGDLVTATPARLPALRYYFDYYDIPKGYIRQSGQFQRAFIIVDERKFETLETIAPQLGFDIPAIDMNTVEVVYQQGDFTVYKGDPIP